MTRNRGRRALAVLFTAVSLLAVGVAMPSSAQAAPLDCKDAPIPEVPGRGVVGFFDQTPAKLPPAGDPFAAGSTTSILEQYGYSGLRFNTYDLGCGPEIARSPDATVGTTIANWIFDVPKTAVAATGALVGAAFAPTFLGVFDPLITSVVEALRRTVFEQWAGLMIAAVGFLLVWRARRASLASSAAAVGWAVLVMVVATVVFQWPLAAGHAADATVTTVLGQVSGGLTDTAAPVEEGAAPPVAGQTAAPAAAASAKAAANLHSALLYQAWLGGMFGDADAGVAKKFGPALFRSQALTWAEAETLRSNPAEGRAIIVRKQEQFKATAAQIQAADPDAYEYLTGHRSDARVGYGMLALLATACAVPFLIVASLLILGALVIVRLGVMLFPAFATVGLFAPMRGLLIGMGNTVAAGIINAIIFGIGAAVTVKGLGVIMSPETGLAPWLVVVLTLLLTLVMWFALRPFRRLTHMLSPGHNPFGDAAGAVGTAGRGALRASGRVIGAALGSYTGNVAADRTAAKDDATRADEARARQGAGRIEGTLPATEPDGVPNGTAPPAEAGTSGAPATSGRGSAGGGASAAGGGAGILAGQARPQTPIEAVAVGGPSAAPAGAEGASTAVGPRHATARSTSEPGAEPAVLQAAEGRPLHRNEQNSTPIRHHVSGPPRPAWQPAQTGPEGLPGPVEVDDPDSHELYLIYRPRSEATEGPHA